MKIDSTGKELLFVTVRISAETPHGASTGTGFIMSLNNDPEAMAPTLLTNKHVVDGATKILVHFISRKPSTNEPDFGKFGVLAINPSVSPFVGHPDPRVDICAIALDPLLGSDQDKVFYRTVLPNLIPSKVQADKLDAIEEVTFVGYPNGRYDEQNGTPIVRKGITATPLALQFGGEPVFLIDGSVFGGSSGSPVFIFNEGSYREGTNLHVGSRIFLVGILAKTMIRQASLPLEVRTAPHVKVAQELNLGVAYDGKAILETLDAVARFHGISRS